ncbi:MAG: SusC/RagA family TonB-linked outer membrane protein, partial [Bacteroidales bacterium]|nr:SusC/RagA family TonB-linked outer membrane protein [Bacteroidales bacterium]
MRITAFLLLFSVIQVMGENSYSQNTRLSLNLKDVSIENVLDEIENQSEFYFLFNQKLVNVDRKVDINAKNKQIKDILADLFIDENINCLVMDRQILLSPKYITEAVNVTRDRQPQEIVVTGKVTDEDGNPLPGVNIIIKGTIQGTITDVDGNYGIEVDDPDAVLVFTFVGMLIQEIKVGDQTEINITLAQDVIGLDEVIAIGYGTTIKSNLTTAVSQVKTDEIPKSANNSVNELLFGRAAGLGVSQVSAEPGGAINLSIRGRGTPLMIVDGIVVPSNSLEPGSGIGEINGVNRGGLADLNPADIESIDVLKDASAAIYGVAAANGVILITTKKGKKGRMNISYDGSRSHVANMDYLTPLNPEDYMGFHNTFSKDRYLFANNMQPFGPNAASGFVPQFSDEDIANAGEGTDWMGMVLRDGSIDNHNLTINGGTDQVTYYFSGNYYNQIGTIENSSLEKYSTRMNLTFNLHERVKLNTSLNYTRKFAENSTAGGQTGGMGVQGFGALQSALSYPTYLPATDEMGNYTSFSTTGNPAALLKIGGETESSTVMANISLDVDIVKDMLKARLLYGNNYESSKRSMFIPSNVFWGQIYQARGSLGNTYRQNQTMEATISFNKSFKEVVHLDVVAGAGQYINNGDGNGMLVTDMLDAIGTDNVAAAPNRESAWSYKNYEKKRSYFARASFDILDRYLVSLVYRLDGIDKFFPDNKYDGFPSVSVGWKISNEEFMQNLDFISLLKLRGSYGITGRPIGTAAYGQYSPDGDQVYFDNGASIYTPYYQTRIDQPYLKWEKTTNSNVGLDFGLYKNRISVSLDYFSDEVTNLLTSRSTDQLSYIATAYENGGARIRDGYDFALKSTIISKSDFSWNMVLNLSHYQYNWKERFENQDLQPYVGEKDPVSAMYVFETDGILQIDETPGEWQPEKAQMPGAPKFVDQNGDKILDENDVVMYEGTPNLSIGFGNNFSYKDFDLGIFFYGQFGAYGWNPTMGWADAKSLSTNVTGATQEIRNTWSTENPDGIWPGPNYDGSILGLPAGIDTRLASKDFVRCRNITLGYTFKEPFNGIIKNARLYFDVQNPFIITDYVGADPETY